MSGQDKPPPEREMQSRPVLGVGVGLIQTWQRLARSPATGWRAGLRFFPSRVTGTDKQLTSVCG